MFIPDSRDDCASVATYGVDYSDATPYQAFNFRLTRKARNITEFPVMSAKAEGELVTGRLYFGDNLDILRRADYIPNLSVDLIYLDPPFNSQAQYNLVFDRPGQRHRSAAQAGAFVDTWRWGEEAELAYRDIMQVGFALGRLIEALRSALRESDMMAYLVMMAVRLREMHLKLKPTGNIFLHCDPTASHYLKLIMDAIFGAENFRNEIIWQRSTGKSLMSKRLPNNHDVILAYQKTGDGYWNEDAMFDPYDPANLPRTVAAKYIYTETDGRTYRLDSLINPNANRPNLTYEFLGVTKVWRWTKERMERAHADGLIVQSAPGRVPQLKRYLEQQRGRAFADVWTDIAPLNSQAQERLGYPTQKPMALLQRILRLASRENDVVLDPFCGCGTTTEAAERLHRRWVGIDVAVHAIKVIEARLADKFPELEYKTEGMPRDFASAESLAERDKYQFQWWANYLFNPHALREQKKGADRGIDGELFFPNGPGRTWGRMLTSVKGGSVGPAMVREFRGVLTRENAQMGLFICLRRPTAAMQRGCDGRNR